MSHLIKNPFKLDFTKIPEALVRSSAQNPNKYTCRVARHRLFLSFNRQKVDINFQFGTVFLDNQRILNAKSELVSRFFDQIAQDLKSGLAKVLEDHHG